MEIGTFKERLGLIFLDFKALEEAEKQVALDLAVGLLRQMLREDNGTKQRLAEIERRARSGADKGGKSGGGKKARVIPPFLMGSTCRTTRPFSVS